MGLSKADLVGGHGTVQTTLGDRRPLAVRLRDDMREHLLRDLGPAEQLPTEADLVSMFGTSRTTVREALKLLEQDGTIRARHGVGRFMATARVERPITRLESVTTVMSVLGLEVTNRVVEVVETGATGEEAGALGIARGDPVIRLDRLRLQGEEPIIYSVDVMPRGLIPAPIEDVDWGGSLSVVLAGFGHRVEYAAARIEAVAAPSAVTAIAGRRGGPWLLLIQTNVDAGGRPIIYSHDYHRGDRFTFEVLRRAE